MLVTFMTKNSMNTTNFLDKLMEEDEQVQLLLRNAKHVFPGYALVNGLSSAMF